MLLDNMKLRQERAALVQEGRAILDKAEREKRPLTATEAKRHDEIMTQCRSLGDRITAIENQQALDRSIEGSLSQSLETAPVRHNWRGELNDGEVRGFRHGQPIAQTMESTLPDGASGNDWQLRRFLRGHVTGNWDGADIERRTHLEGTAATGGIFVPTVIAANMIDLARNESRLSQAGMITVPMTSAKMIIGKVVTDPTPVWRGENQTITESDASYEGVTFEAKTIAVLTSVSVELLEDASGFTNSLERRIAAAIALEIDRAGLFGDGVNEPLGIFDTEGVLEVSMGTNGATPTDHEPFSNACQSIMLQNGNPTAAIFSPRTWGTMDRLLGGDGHPLKPLQSYVDLKKLVTNQVPVNLTHGSATTASTAIVGGFENVLMGIRTNLQIEASRVAGSDAFSKMKVMIRAYARLDFAIARATHLCKITGILA